MDGMAMTGSDATMTGGMGGMNMPMATAASSAGMAMGGLGGNGQKCKISMLWNWNTVDACFLSSGFQIRNAADFAGTCIFVLALVMAVEFLRRTAKEYDRYLVREHLKRTLPPSTTSTDATSTTLPTKETSTPACSNSLLTTTTSASTVGKATMPALASMASVPFRPNWQQQAVRAALHTLQFAGAYITMLMAMYYNGYIILCIVLGAFAGAFIFQWETIQYAGAQTGVGEEPTVCCG